MWSIIHKHKINISHHLALDYNSKSMDNHGHILTVSIELFSTRLNANNMVIDTDKLNTILDKLEGDVNKYMNTNNMKGNATLENIILIIKTKTLMVIQKENTTYSTDVLLRKIAIEDESGRKVIYNMQ